MKKKTAKFLAVLMCLMTAVAFMPTFAFAAEAEVTFTVSVKGVIARAKDGSIMAKRNVTVKDIDADGVLSFDEALVALHKEYCAEGELGYATSDGQYGASVNKLWGADTYNTLFFTNGISNSSSVDCVLVKEGDQLYASVNCDDLYYADWFTSFDTGAKTVATGEEFSLTLTGCQGMAYPYDPSNPVKGVEIGIWEEGKFKALSEKKTDENGQVTLSFEEAGTYCITASGTVRDNVTDWSTYASTEYDCPIIAPFCFVTVYKDNKQMTAKENAVKVVGISSFSVKVGKKSATVKWVKNSTFSGYQIYYKQAKKSAKHTTTTAASKTIKKLAKGKKITFKVRGYKKMNGKTIYGKWSATKTVKIK